MEPERWQEIERLYYSTLNEEKSARASFLERACRGDEALRRTVEMLLAQEEQRDTLKSMNTLALCLVDLGRYAEAKKLDRETLDIRRRVLGPEHPDTLKSMSHLAGLLTTEGQLPEAERLNREAFNMSRRVLRLENSDTLRAMANLADSLAKVGNSRAF